MTSHSLSVSRPLRAAALLALPLAACTDAPLSPRGPVGPLTFTVQAASSGFVPCNGEVPVTVTVTDSLAQPVEGLLLNLHAVGGTGSFYSGSGLTSDLGVVKDYWTIGGKPNTPYSFEARTVDPVTGEKKVYFTQTVTAQTRIVFGSSRDGNWEIYSANPDGSDPRRLTNNTAADIHPAWSPTAQRIAFVSNRDGNYEIYTMAPDGTDVQRLTTNTAADVNPTWAPHGSRIAFASIRDGVYEIYVMNANGTGQERTTFTNTVDANPHYGVIAGENSSSTRLVYTSSESGNAELYITPTSVINSNRMRLTNNAATDDEAEISPDGTKVAFMSTRDGNREIYVMNINGTGVTRLTNHAADDRSPTWSPDGGSIAFVSTRDGAALETYTMKADGTGLLRLTNTKGQEDVPSWSVCAS
jgi:tricorn protease-like protein